MIDGVCLSVATDVAAIDGLTLTNTSDVSVRNVTSSGTISATGTNWVVPSRQWRSEHRGLLEREDRSRHAQQR
jgi:hypothetical protein